MGKGRQGAARTPRPQGPRRGPRGLGCARPRVTRTLGRPQADPEPRGGLNAGTEAPRRMEVWGTALPAAWEGRRATPQLQNPVTRAPETGPRSAFCTHRGAWARLRPRSGPRKGHQTRESAVPHHPLTLLCWHDWGWGKARVGHPEGAPLPWDLSDGGDQGAASHRPPGPVEGPPLRFPPGGTQSHRDTRLSGGGRGPRSVAPSGGAPASRLPSRSAGRLPARPLAAPAVGAQPLTSPALQSSPPRGVCLLLQLIGL